MKLAAILLALLVSLATPAFAQAEFLTLRPDEAGGRLLVELPPPDADGTAVRALYSSALQSGVGSNPLGLDRGLRGPDQIVRMVVRGGRVVIEAENSVYRAVGAPPAEQRAVRDSFARSVLWSGEVEESLRSGGVVVDLSDFFSGDALGLAQRLGEEDGTFALDADRTAVLVREALSFPDNIAVAAELTFTSSKPGPQVRAVTPDPRAVTVTVHHILARLPEPGFQPRENDPRFGAISYGFYDFAAPLDAPVKRGYSVRHRTDEPIVYYVDPGAPPAIRDALIEGASWWADAFAAAGHPGGYRVEVLPEDAHPLDIRYNIIQWVHRQTRGWSYGQSLVDPRTGEIVKGHVILGSQRVRQDRMIFEGLAGVAGAADTVALSLARIRQLSAHEVGHTLGFSHNFAASSAGRSSVMDYPAPWVIAKDDGTLDFSQTYASGIGEWDKVAATWLYGDLEPEAADRLIDTARATGLLFIEDQHGRGPSTAHPRAADWDNGSDLVAELANTMRVREIALSRFGSGNLRPGAQMAELREVIVPIYLYHRYQTAAAAKSIGGLDFRYGANGIDQQTASIVPAERQRQAIAAVLGTLDTRQLDLPEPLLALMLPPPSLPANLDSGETFAGLTGEAFDLFAAVETAADISFDALLAPERLERMAQFAARDASYPAPAELFERIEGQVLGRQRGERAAAIGAVVAARYVAALIELDDAARSDTVRAAVRQRLHGLRDGLKVPEDEALTLLLKERIDAHLERPAPARETGIDGPEIPPGSPIGG